MPERRPVGCLSLTSNVSKSMIFRGLLAALGLIATLCPGSARNVTIENDTGDAETGVLPLYGPSGTLDKWQYQELKPQDGDTNPENISSFVSTDTTISSEVSTVSQLTLLFAGMLICPPFAINDC